MVIMSRSGVQFFSRFSEHFHLANLLQRTKLQDILKTVAHTEDLVGMFWTVFHLFVNLLKFDKEPFVQIQGWMGWGATSK